LGGVPSNATNAGEVGLDLGVEEVLRSLMRGMSLGGDARGVVL